MTKGFWYNTLKDEFLRIVVIRLRFFFALARQALELSHLRACLGDSHRDTYASTASSAIASSGLFDANISSDVAGASNSLRSPLATCGRATPFELVLG